MNSYVFDLQRRSGQAIFCRHFPIGSETPGNETWNYIRCKLATRSGKLHLNLATVEWSLFAQLSPKNFGVPVAQGLHVMTAGSPLLEIAVPASKVSVGWHMLILAAGDGTTALACPVLVGP